MMNFFLKIVRRTGGIGSIIGALFLVIIMIIVVLNVVVRFFGPTIIGTYELVTYMIVVTVAFALVRTTLEGAHITVNIFISRFSEKIQIMVGILTSLVGLSIWLLITWASIQLLLERGLSEKTDLLKLPIFLFRGVWIFGLILFCLVLAGDLYKLIRRSGKK